MADFVAFAIGENNLLEAGQGSPIKAGMPSAAIFCLSTLLASAIPTSCTSLASIGEISPDWYTRASLAAPTPSGGNLQYGTASWGTTDTTGPAAVKSVVLVSCPTWGAGASGIPYCAWNLIAGGTPVDLSQNGVTLNVTPLLTTGT